METLWFALLVLTLATYVVLDGFDLGVGALHLFVAKTEPERRQVLRSIGPVWDGNEVWLLATGGVLFLAFPRLLATALSGFYLPIMVVLWLLLLRALGIELRHQLADPLWTAAWDAVFWLASTLLVIFLGAALGNVVRGVSYQPEGHFFAPLWTHGDVTSPVGVLDWYTVPVALAALVALALHGALWLEWRTDAAVQERAGRLASRLWPLAVGGAVAVTALSLVVQPLLLQHLRVRPWVALAGLPTLALLLVPWLRRRRRARAAFFASVAHLYGLLGAAAASLYPSMLPAAGGGVGLRAADVAAADYSLRVGLVWWPPGMLLVLLCHRFVYGKMPRTFAVQDESQH